ncbi:hypothetical protein Tco_0374097 [Tanacetum coccineum]
MPKAPSTLKNFVVPRPHHYMLLPSCNPNNNNGWLAVDDYLLGELEAMVDEQMVVPVIDETAEQMVVPTVEEIAEPVVEAEEEQVITPVVDVAEDWQMDAPMIAHRRRTWLRCSTMTNLEDDASDGFGEDEVGSVNEDGDVLPTTPPRSAGGATA